MLSTLAINGFRGFSTSQQLRLAVPNGQPGSGLTVLVGGNNSGKSTVLEALRCVALSDEPALVAFTRSMRNVRAGGKVEITAEGTEGEHLAISTKPWAVSQADFKHSLSGSIRARHIHVVPARRSFAAYFGAGEWDKYRLMMSNGFPALRQSELQSFGGRLLAARHNHIKFNNLLARILNGVPDWSIDLNDHGQHHLQFNSGDASHTSDGLGQGVVSLFSIVDALYDAGPKTTIGIDEPELSLHPAYQRRLSLVFEEYSAERQIVLATHSPYMIPLQAVANGATVARVYQSNEGCVISQLTEETGKEIKGILDDVQNPHTLGTNAQEVFFAEDGIVLFEGQEDVIFLKRITDQLGVDLGRCHVYGWGTGGGNKMLHILAILRDLGFRKVIGILDNDQPSEIERLKDKYTEYKFVSIPAKGIRSRKEQKAKEAVDGLLDNSNKTVRPELFEDAKQVFEEVRDYLHGGQAPI